MKKLLASLTILTILALPLGSAASAEQQTPPADLSVEEVHGNIPAQADAAQTMYPAVHSLVLAMTENDLEYAPEDSEFLWTSLYYMLSLYGQMDERAEFTDDTLILPSEMVRDYAAALYPQVEQLPGIPSPISQRIRYQASDDSYHLARGDEGLAEVGGCSWSSPRGGYFVSFDAPEGTAKRIVGLAKEAGCNDFLIKPLSQYSLNKALNSVLVDLKKA